MVEGEWCKEDEGERYGLAPKEITGGGASGGARGGIMDLATMDPTTPMKSSESEEQEEAIVVCGVQLALTVTAPFADLC
jgi:hypothetical protein